jgi:hypothetical protein
MCPWLPIPCPCRSLRQVRSDAEWLARWFLVGAMTFLFAATLRLFPGLHSVIYEGEGPILPRVSRPERHAKDAEVKGAFMILKSSVFWGITRRRGVIVYRRFGTTYRSHPHGSRVRVIPQKIADLINIAFSLDARPVTWIKFHVEASQLDASVQNDVSMATWRLGFVHPCIKFRLINS